MHQVQVASIRNMSNELEANSNPENMLLQLVHLTGDSPNSNCHRTDNLGNGQVHRAQDTATSRGFLEVTDAEMARYRLRCGIWMTCLLAAGFVRAAKFYFNQGTGLKVLVYYGLLVTLLLSGYFYSIIFRRTEDAVPGDNDLHTQDDPIAALTAANTIANESVGLPAIVTPVGQNPSPPPFHIAILIPPCHSAEEIPPPSYDKITVH